mgnify:CR=1 FL=1
MLGNTHTKQLTNQDEKHLRFLIDVCITPNTAFSNQIDFPELLSLAQRHRLVGSLNKAVSAQKANLPTRFVANLSEVASKIAFKNLQLCHQLVLLAQKFKQEELLQTLESIRQNPICRLFRD